MEIYELKKPVGDWCPHCAVGKGCSIYGMHPPSCQVFACQWMLNLDVPERFRPDRARVVLTAEENPGDIRIVANCDPANSMAWRQEPFYGWLKDVAASSWRSGGSVVAKAYNRLWLIGPNGDLDLGNVDQRSPVKMEQRLDGTYTAEVLPPIEDGQDIAQALGALRDEATE